MRSLTFLAAALLAAPACAVETPGSVLARQVRRRLVSGDLLAPVDRAALETSETQWEGRDPDWEGAVETADGLDELRGALTGDDADALEEGVRELCEAVEVGAPGDDALAARYEALRAALRKDGVDLEPETARMRLPDGRPLDAADWRRRLEAVPPALRKRLVTIFGQEAGIGAEAPKDFLALAPKPRKVKAAPAKPQAHAAAKKTSKAAPPKKEAPPKPAGPKEAAVAKARETLKTALAAEALKDKLTPAERDKLLDAWGRALDASTGDDGLVDYSKAVNGLRDLLAPESTAARRWGRSAAAAYNLGSELGPKTVDAASQLVSGASLGAGRLFTKALALAGQATEPKDQPDLATAVRAQTAVDSAAAAWAGSLPNASKSNPVNGAVKTLKLEGTVKSWRDRFGI